jgi:carbonyl reductase 1
MATTRALSIVTGANRGLGFEAAKGIAAAGLDVVLLVRSADKGAEAAAQLKAAVPEATFHVVGGFDASDASSFDAAVEKVRAAAAQQPITVLLNNAGINVYDEDRASRTAADIAAATMAVNYYGVKAFIDKALPLLANGARVVNVASQLGYARQVFGKGDEGPAAAVRERWTSSIKSIADVDALVDEYLRMAAEDPKGASRHGWAVDDQYGMSKLALTAYVEQLAASEPVSAKGITVTSMCPGYCKTDMTRGGGMKTAAEGADTMVWLATSADVQGATGKHYADRKERDWRVSHM